MTFLVSKMIIWLLLFAIFSKLNLAKIKNLLINIFQYLVDFPKNVLIHIIIKLSELENRLANGTSEKLQMSSLISIFIEARGMVESFKPGKIIS